MGTGWGAGLLPLDRPEKKPSLCSPPVQVPDGATVRLIPQLHNGGAISQSLAQSCSSGESESRNPDACIPPREPEAAPGHPDTWGSPGLASGPAKTQG